MTEINRGYWTRIHTPSGKDVLGWVSDQGPPALKLGDGRTPAIYLQKQKNKSVNKDKVTECREDEED